MQTQCPHCETRFRITETQANLADGMVRCGVCQQVFHAFEVAKQDEHLDTLSGLEESTEEQTDSIAIDGAEETDNSENLDLTEASQPEETTDQLSNELDFFSEEDSFSKSVVPDKFRESHARPPYRIISTLLWSVGILLLTATLLVEHIWFNRDRFIHIPELQASMEKLCRIIECREISVRDPEKIELVSRNVYSHPNEKNALVINVTIKNNADFAQPYPVMQISFSNVRGSTVAARRFLPSDYLPAKSNPLARLAPNESQSLNLEIQDPGEDSETYEFNFL